VALVLLPLALVHVVVLQRELPTPVLFFAPLEGVHLAVKEPAPRLVRGLLPEGDVLGPEALADGLPQGLVRSDLAEEGAGALGDGEILSIEEGEDLEQQLGRQHPEVAPFGLDGTLRIEQERVERSALDELHVELLDVVLDLEHTRLEVGVEVIST